MNCSRCQGIMIVDSFIDTDEGAGLGRLGPGKQDASRCGSGAGGCSSGCNRDTGQLWLSAWRCVNCGQVHDPGVIRNRIAPRCVAVTDVKRLRSKPRVAHAPIAIRVSA